MGLEPRSTDNGSTPPNNNLIFTTWLNGREVLQLYNKRLVGMKKLKLGSLSKFNLWNDVTLKDNKTPGTDRVVNEFLKYGGSEVRNKLLKIMNMILKKGKYLTILGKP
jgi:hypothetical protein